MLLQHCHTLKYNLLIFAISICYLCFFKVAQYKRILREALASDHQIEEPNLKTLGCQK